MPYPSTPCGRPAVIFYPFGPPTPYAYAYVHAYSHLRISNMLWNDTGRYSCSFANKTLLQVVATIRQTLIG
jgi:hypothetical protein